jgi:restriction system protein
MLQGLARYLPTNYSNFMNFKMRENSVFAILLRSPWWMSAGVAVVLASAAAALMPAQYLPFGVMSATPFVVIAGMVLWRGRNAPDPQRFQAALAQAATMPWRSFAAALEKAFTAQGYAVTLLPGDQANSGADIRLEKNEQITLVSAKRYKAATHGTEPLRELGAAVDKQAAQRSMYVSLDVVTEQAASFAKEQGIELLFGDRLGALLIS